MPKKPVHGRAKQNRNRTRRPGSQSVTRSNSVATVEPMDATFDTVSGAGFAASTAPVAASAGTSRVPGASAASRRSASAVRRTPVLTVNYHYLARDLRSLAVLAPAMVVLLVIAFFVFH